jgi:selenocysteine lyase/cysteine desulfurase
LRQARAARTRRDSEILIDRIRASVIGDDVVLDGPFGARRIVYADATASGRSVSFVEDLIRDQVLPMYGNTHTEASATGRRTTGLREDARRIIHRAVNGGEHDVVIFSGSGATAAIDKLIRLLALDPWDRPVVFIGPYEHHSNELPWRESVADLVTIGQDSDGGLDLVDLEYQLRRYADRTVKIGSFSAASNVTGIVTDVDRITITLHRHGALACWDYAAAGPYLAIDMNASPDLPDGRLAYKDAVFISPHKFIGGPGTPGVLVAKQGLFRSEVPSVPGGGTVLFVSPSEHAYHPDPAVREEGGTPGIVESIRAGLVFALKEQVGTDEIRRREYDLARRALASWRANPRIEILGSTKLERLPIIAFGLRHAGRRLHANFIVALLSDLFGIQARSGCFCAGPYVHRLSGIDEGLSARMQAEAVDGHMGAMLGFTRLTFNYFMSERAFAYILDAVHLLADHGWKLLPLYRFDPVSGLWRHRADSSDARPNLADMLTATTAAPATAPESALAGQLDAARRIIADVETHPPSNSISSGVVGEQFERIRWFPLPGEALSHLRANQAEGRA